MRRFGFFLLALGLFLAGLGRDLFDDWVDATEIPPLIQEVSVEVLDREGTLLRAFTVADGRWRLQTRLDQVDPGYVDMLLAYEDKRFYGHAGVDPWAMLRALGQAALNGRVVSGGSTLTMQVARLLEEGPTGTLEGKLRQVRLALALERELTKDQILELYLNRAPFGGNLEGVRSATRAYLGKEPRRLTPAEAALLVAIPQSPERRRPDRYVGNAIDARERVLWRARDRDQLTMGAVEAALTEPVPNQRLAMPALAAHLTNRVFAKKSSAVTHKTTLDGALQARLEALGERAAREAGQRLSIAIMVADHQTGEVLASVGSAGYRADARHGFVDMTQAIRSPGSTLKPLVYGLAFDQGLAHPETLIDDKPVAFGDYSPQNFDGVFRGTLRVREALKQSLNIPVVKLTEELGPARVLSQLRRAGVETKLPGGAPGLAISLGGIGVNLEGLLQLYAALARGGEPISLSYLRRPASKTSTRLMGPESAWLVGDILSEIAPPPGSGRKGLAYKTGTSYGHRDAWAIGYDGAHVIGIWMGRPDGTPVPGAFGGDLAAPVLFEAFALLKPEFDRLPPPPPSTLLVSHTQLPQPLKRFRGRDAVFHSQNAPKVVFPPDGARVEAAGGSLAVKLRDGVPPFTMMVDGRPVRIKSFERAFLIDDPGPGFLTLSVVDAQGASASSRIQID